MPFSDRILRIGTWVAIGAFFIGVGAILDYVRIRVSSRSYDVLVVENTAQKAQLGEYEKAVGVLEKKINSFRDYAAKLNIFAGINPSDMLKPGFPRLSDLKPPDISEKMGVGGSATPDETKTVFLEEKNSADVISPIFKARLLAKTADEIEKDLGNMLTRFEEIQESFAVRPSISPTDGYRSSTYGWRTDPFTDEKSFHAGVDVATGFGNTVVATADGSVIQVGYDGNFGNCIVINHGNGITTLYGHLSKTLVRSGQRIKRGEKIGQVGHSGRAMGDHVHYEVRVNGKPVNPNSYILTDY
ncbi:MAG: M23 family metallopeptidase [Candidatus Aminicenantales bacterium]